MIGGLMQESTLLVLVAPLVSSVVVGGASYVAVRVAIARIETRQAERDKDVEKRLDLLYKKVGIMNGHETEFMRRSECVFAHENASTMRLELTEQINALRNEMRSDMLGMGSAFESLRLELTRNKNTGG